MIRLARASRFLVWIQTFPEPDSSRTNPSPPKIEVFMPPDGATPYEIPSVKATR